MRIDLWKMEYHCDVRHLYIYHIMSHTIYHTAIARSHCVALSGYDVHKIKLGLKV